MSTNNKISTLVPSQVPFFVRNDHAKFMAFIEAYYEYLEQSEPTLGAGKVVERAKNLQSYSDIDSTLDNFTDYLYQKFLKDFPTNTLADLSTVLKNSKDFYRSKGSEKATRFLLRTLFDKEIEFYYPKKDVLRASDGKWYIKRSLRVNNTQIENSANTEITALQKYVGTKVRGETSNATAIVEEVDRFYDSGELIDELVISSIVGNFDNGENVLSVFVQNGQTYNLRSEVFGAGLSSITVTKTGSGYVAGDEITITSNTGSGAQAFITRVSSGNIGEISVISGGSGFQNGDVVAITGGGGTGATANLLSVNPDATIHPNSYNIVITLIGSDINTAVGNAVYSNINPLVSDPANATMANVLSSFLYGNTGPAQLIRVITSGNNFVTVPEIGVVANTRIKEAGIIGRIDIVSGGTGYANGDFIQFINGPYSFGYGANANVTVNATGTIIGVTLLPQAGQITGGSGYDQNYLPSANVWTSTGSNANLQVTSLLGFGGTFLPANSTLGAIEKITITNRGADYATAPVIDLTGLGDGTAQAYSNIVSGIVTYPGRYLNDDGHLSSFNFLQDRDYYQNFSYVIRIEESLDKFKLALKNLLHPAGMKLFVDYAHISSDVGVVYGGAASETVVYHNNGQYVSTLGNVYVTLTSHGISTGNNVYLEFTSGNVTSNAAITANISNGFFVVAGSSNANTFYVNHPTSLATTLGNVIVGKIVA